MAGSSRLLALLLVSLAGSAHAGPDEARLAAQTLKDRAAIAMAKGDYAMARDLFGQAYTLFPSPNMLYNLGVVALKLGDEPGAANALSRALAESSGLPAEAQKFSRERLRELELRLGRAHVVVPAREVELTLDGAALGRSPFDRVVWVTPGVHRLEAAGSGYHPASVRCEVAVGSEVECSPAMVALPAPAPAVVVLTVERPPPPPRRRRGTWIAVGVVTGVVVVGGAVALGVVLGTRHHYPDATVGTINAN